MGLGFNLCVAPSPRNQVSQILDGAEKNSEKEWNEGVQKDYRILVYFDYKLESRFVVCGIIYKGSEIMEM